MALEQQRSVDLDLWRALKAETYPCTKCQKQWPWEVSNPLRPEESPDPPSQIKTLFVGVAPTALEGRNAGQHFYSSTKDSLRYGLFGVLGIPNDGIQSGNKRFLDARFFFVHMARIRPIRDMAPSPEVLNYCAKQHLAAEIRILNPSFVCFLGFNCLSAAEAVLGQLFWKIPMNVDIEGWKGRMVVAPQPVRNRDNKRECKRTLDLLWAGM